MKENNKINRRSRPRPFDLRRKVLLKNFLREQMKQVPHIELTPTAQNGDGNLSEETPNSLEIDNLKEVNDENTSTHSTSAEDSASSAENIEDSRLANDKNDKGIFKSSSDSAVEPNSAVCSKKEPKYFRFVSLMNLRSESKKKKVKGILKAKKICKTVKSPVKSKPFKSGLNRLLRSRTASCSQSSEDKATKVSSNSLLSLFKSRREQRKLKEVHTTKQVDTKLISKDEKYTSSQSVQTENSWCREELDRVQQSNMLLREENRLLSESLSYFMSSNSLDSQIGHCSSSLQYSNKSTLRRSPGYDRDLASGAMHDRDYWYCRTRISRSKSMQVHVESRDKYRKNYRTRSMNTHDSQNEHLNRSSISASLFRPKVPEFSVPSVRRKNVLASLPVNNAVKIIQRRSSMPERILSENDRSRMCRRSGSVVVSSTRTPFHSLPSEAFY